MFSCKRLVLSSMIFLFCMGSSMSVLSNFDEIKGRQQLITFDGFSISSPDEYGWYCKRGVANKNSVGLSKAGSSPYESYVFQVWAENLPGSSQHYGDMEYYLLLSRNLVNGWDKSRFVKIKLDFDIVDTRHGKCLGFLSLHQDLQARKGSEDTDPLLLEALGLICRYPNDNSGHVNFVYSHRYHPANWDSSLAAKAQVQFDSVEFDTAVKNTTSKVCQ